ncbi:hypothetical protein RMATCC62417_13917 [Rhizopus microsporus]|nr:hypothetical protein RMATCC62417_13917 [Rhizopus microsporus]
MQALKDKGYSKTMKFYSMIQTDGVGISVVKQNQEPTKGGSRSTSTISTTNNDNEFTYIHKLATEELQNTTGKYVFIDPGRRGMLYYMPETSNSAKNKDYLYQYTSNQRAKEIKARKFKKLRQDTKPESVKECEIYLSKYPVSTVNVVKFSEFLKARSKADEPLSSYYLNEDKA